MYPLNLDWYYYCEDSQDCADHHAAKINAQHAAAGNRMTIEYINPTPRMDNTIQGLPFSVGFETKVTSYRADGSGPFVTVSPGPWTESMGRCPVQENGMNWMSRIINYWPHLNYVCVLRLPEDQNTCGDGVGNPIYPEAQLKLQREKDYISQDGLLDFVRTYRSDTGRFSSLLAQRLIVANSTNAEPNSYCDILDYKGFPGSDPISQYCFKDATSSHGQPIQLVDNSGNYKPFDASADPDNPSPNPNESMRLKRATDSNKESSWRLSRDRYIERFDASGRLLERHLSDGRFVSYIYSNSDTPKDIAPRTDMMIAAQDAWGRMIKFIYQDDGKLLEFQDPAGNKTRYKYAADGGQISEVEYPDGSKRRYFWNEPALAPFPTASALTGIEHENGARSSFGYNSFGRAISTERAGGVDKWVLSPGYNNVIVTDPFGTNRTLGLTKLHGTVYSTTRSQPAGAGCDASSASRSYDANGNIISKTDFNGTVTSYTYDLDRNLETQRIEVSGTLQEKVISTEWHPDWRLKIRQSQPKKITTWIYNGQPDMINGGTASCAPVDAEVVKGMPIAVVCAHVEQTTTDENGSDGFNATPIGAARVSSYTYNHYGKLLTSDGVRTDVADIWQYEYWLDDAVCPGAGEGTGMDKGCRGKLSRSIDPMGHVTEHLKYNAHGQLLEKRSPNNLITKYVYNQRQQMIKIDIGGQITKFDYNSHALTRIVPAGGQPIVYTYDTAGRLIRITQEATGEYIHYTLDGMGNRTAEHIYDANGSKLQYEKRKVYDALGRLAESIGADSQATGFQYDAVGNLTQVINANRMMTSWSYDAKARPIQTTDTLDGVTTYAYDALGHLTEITTPNGTTTTYDYDGLGNLLREQSPDRGLITYRYDAVGNRTAITDARGISLQYEYDALNRLTDITTPDATQDIHFTYDQGIQGIGRLSRMEDGNGTIEYTYDAQGNRTGESLHYAEGGQSAWRYHYDTANRLSGITYPGGLELFYDRDAAGQISRVRFTIDGQTTVLVDEINYQPFGPPKQWKYGNGLSHQRHHNLDGRLVKLVQGGALDKEYTHDAVGNLTAILTGASTLAEQTFTYDALDRLDLADGPFGSQDYDHGPNGNRLRLVANGVTGDYDYLANSNRLLQDGQWHYDHDASGNTVARLDSGGQGRVFTYNAHNRLSQVFERIPGAADRLLARYGYNGRGERVTKEQATETRYFHYGPQGELLAELDAGGELQRAYVYLDGYPLALIEPQFRQLYQACTSQQASLTQLQLSGAATFQCGAEVIHTADLTLLSPARLTLTAPQISLGPETRITRGAILQLRSRAPDANLKTTGLYYLHPDHLGSPRAVSDESGQVIWRWKSEPFGGTLPEEDPDGDGQPFVLNLRFPGQYFDVESGLYYNYFRYYDPDIGRYITSDPIGLDGGLNTYGYADGNPATRADPRGLAWIPGADRWIDENGKYYPFGGPWCGSGWSAYVVPDSVFGVIDHTEACKLHDRCYASCGTPKWVCDLLLLTKSGSPLYYFAVDMLGRSAYDKAQEESCETDCN